MAEHHLSAVASEFIAWLKDWSIMLGLVAGGIAGLSVFIWNATIGRMASRGHVKDAILVAVQKAEDDLKECHSTVIHELRAHEKREDEKQEAAAKENRDAHQNIINILMDKLK